MSDLSKPQFHDENAAREWLERELWPGGPICPHCGTINQATLLQRGTKPRKSQPEPEKKRLAREGLYQCNSCREPFTVTVGTLYERSHIPQHKWLAATHLMMASKKGMSAMQIHRMLGISYKSSWFMCHRIRESLRETKLATPLGGEDKFVEADETYVGCKAKNRAFKAPPLKEAVMSLVERGDRVRSHHLPDVTATTLKPILVDAIAKDTHFRTDQSPVYLGVGAGFSSHEAVNHSIKEYVRGDACSAAIRMGRQRQSG